MFNLIGNALKYTMSGCVARAPLTLHKLTFRFVHVQISYGPAEAVFTVKDSGVGIPCESTRYRQTGFQGSH